MTLDFNQHDQKLRLRRLFRRRRKDVIEIGKQANDNVENLLLRRMSRLVAVRRFVFLWSLLFIVMIIAGIYQLRALDRYYLSAQPAPGGTMREGMVGAFTNANPIYASGTADATVSRLIFSGLFRYDSQNTLVGDLATGWRVDPTTTQYTITLRNDVYWHDGAPFTADDVVYTYQTIQKADAKSSLYANWQGITVTKKDDFTVIFRLPNALSSFPYALTNGILPRHLLGSVPPAELRTVRFNTLPIGTGPFVWRSLEVSGTSNNDREQRITLAANDDYFHGKPKLEGFNLRIFHTEKQLIDSYNRGEVLAASSFDGLPRELDANNTVLTRVPLSSAVMVFFNTAQSQLSDVHVRRALINAVDRTQVAKQVPQAISFINSPLLRNQLGHVPGIEQPGYDPKAANAELDAAGWKLGAEGLRSKDGKPLVIQLRSQNTVDYTHAAQFVLKAWKALGVKVEVRYFSGEDLQSTTIVNRDYDALLYGINIGVDPDVFAYWHSSQVGSSGLGRLNLSEYRSVAADQALEAGRIRSEPELRASKYRTFLETWSADLPALALYQPSYLYISRAPIHGFGAGTFNSRIDRFNNVEKWQIRETKQPIK